MLRCKHTRGKAVLLPLICLTVLSNLYADTTWVDAVNVSGVWDNTGSPYMIHEGPVCVDSSLTINAGTRIVFTDTFSIRISGVLTVTGTETDSVFFTTDSSIGNNGWRGLRFQEGTGAINYAVFENGSATGHYEERYGGAIACSASVVEISHSTFRNNDALISGGAIYAYDSSRIRLEDCIIQDNSAEIEGGGIYIRTASSLEIARCTVFNNYAAILGGGIGLETRCLLEMENCVIDSNFASNRGGGLLITSSDSAFIYSSLFRENQSRYGGGCFASEPDLTIDGCLFIDNEAFARGGAAYVSMCELRFVSTIVTGSYPQGLYLENLTDETIQYNCFDNNSGLNIEGDADPRFGVIASTNFIGEPCDSLFNIFSDPSFVDPENGDYHLTNSSPCICGGKHSGVASDIEGTQRPNPMGSPPDIGILENDLHLPHTFLCGSLTGTLSADTFLVGCDLSVEPTSSLTIEAGCNLRFLGPYTITVEGQLIVAGSESDTIVFERNASYDSLKWYGFRFEAGSDGSQLDHCRISDTRVPPDGAIEHPGAVRCNNTNIEVGNTLFESNDADCIVCLNTASTIRDCNFRTNGHTTVYGIHADGTTITNCTFSDQLTYNCSAFVWDNSTNVSIFDSEIRNYHSWNYSPGIHAINGSDIIARRCSFINCYYDGTVSSHSGSHILLDECTCTIPGESYSNSRFAEVFDDASLTAINCNIHNQSNSYSSWQGEGGAVSCNNVAEATLINCLFFDNRGWYGGVVSGNDTSRINMTGCIMTGNTAYRGGGAVFLDDHASGQFTNCQFIDNWSDDSWGGAVYLFGDSTNTEFIKCNWSGNYIIGDGYGGAVTIRGGEHSFERSQFVDNSATIGGAMFIRLSNTLVRNCSFSQNIGTQGAGITLDNTIAEITNSVIAYSYGQGLYFHNTSDSSIVAFNNIYGNRGGSVGYYGDLTERGPENLAIMMQTNVNGDSSDQYFNISADPHFVDTTVYNLSILQESHCINAGDPTSPLDPDSSISDIGYEPYVLLPHQLQPFSLLSPADEATIQQDTARLIWEPCLDLDAGEPVQTYLVQVATDEEFTAIVLEQFSNDTSYLASLPDDTLCYWRILAVSENGQNRWSNEVWRIITFVPEPPTAPVLLQPQDSDTVDRENPVDFCWTLSIDPDPGDVPTYNLYFTDGDTVIVFETIEDTCQSVAVAEIGLIDSLQIEWWVEAVSSMPDTIVECEERRHFRIEQVSAISQFGEVIPDRIALYPGYPNPFNAETTLRYDIPCQSHVRITAMNVLGQEVAVLVDSQQSPGRYSIHWLAREQASGMYFIKLERESDILLQKIILLR